MTEAIKKALAEKNYTHLKMLLSQQNSADAAELIESLPKLRALEVFRILPKDMAADVFSYFSHDMQQEMITSLSDADANEIIENLYSDDVVDLLEEMPSNVVRRILAHAGSDTREYVDRLLQYPKESAGSLMGIEYISLKEHWRIKEAMEELRKNGSGSQTVNVCYVLTDSRRLVGVVSLKDLVFSDPEEELSEVMTKNPVTVLTLDDQEDVAEVFQKYNFSVLPVVDSENHMVGIVTVDDIIDVMEREATEDMQKMAAVIPNDKPYLSSSVWQQVNKRLPWLLLLMLSASFTGAIITSFEDRLSQCIVLTAYIPMLMDSGGNAGGQASTTIIRAISLEDIRLRDTLQVLWKESRVALCCGLILAAINFVKMQLIDRAAVVVSAVVCLTLVVTIFCAKLIGSVLPLLAKRIGLDPAVMANPIITTIVDAISLLVYFGISSCLMDL